MEYQQMIIFLDNKLNQPSKFRTKSWIEVNDNSRGTYESSNQIRF